MDYRELFKKENEKMQERHLLAIERIRLIGSEHTVPELYAAFFQKTAAFILQMESCSAQLERGVLEALSLEEWKRQNKSLYADILPEAYEESYANPAYAVRVLGEEFGALLSFLYTEIRSMIVYVYEHRLTDRTILEEIFIEVYNLFEETEPEVKELKAVLYYFVSDYCDVTLPYRIRETLDPELDFAKTIIMESDLRDLRYLYRFGEYISENELRMAEFLTALPEEIVQKMADTYTEGYLKGFEVSGRSYQKKKTVQLRFPLGFERMIRLAIENFRRAGLEPVIPRAAIGTMNRTASRTGGYYAAPANRQYEYDHRYDNALYLDKAFRERKIGVLKVAYERYKKLAADYAGPAVVETFGEAAFQPVNKKEAFSLSEKQEKILLAYSNEAMQVIDSYIPGRETSFTIIAFPLPEIGEQFEEIFNETIRINTLDYETYQRLQQTLIDALDQAEYVEIRGGTITEGVSAKDETKGKAGRSNETRLKIYLSKLTDPTRETNFENCVADVNIPVGEVFTSPRLAGTEGILHVGSVYIGEFQFKDLKLVFQNGRIVSYSCQNFNTEEENRALVKQVILKNHDSLPMGEFAIGTNTTAYAVARKYGILDKFPILIAEKMGPHFAVGDTCYSWMEDCPMYNPDGKEMVARDNEVSILRKEDPQKAYFGCHTDITIPYAELGTIEAVHSDGTRTAIIEDGRFVLSGTEELNQALEEKDGRNE